jgi:hypothetical protein
MAVGSKVGPREGGSLGGLPMRVRADSVLVSSVLHTIALLSLLRAALWNYSAGRDKALLAQMDAGFRADARTTHYLGIACLAIILIGLIVIWTGYVKRARSAWLVMFVVVWFWAFPLFVFPFLQGVVRGLELSFSELLYDAIAAPGGLRLDVEAVLIFSLMIIALVLPMKKFFLAKGVEEPTNRPSARLVGFSLLSVLVVMIALYAWISVGVLYEIPVTALNMTDRLPPPPAPPNKCKCPDGN